MCGLSVQLEQSIFGRTPPSVQNHLVLIRTVLVTPTRILVGPPMQEPSNSVTRRYADKLDGIIRVQFTDEEDQLFVSPSETSGSCLTQIRCMIIRSNVIWIDQM